MVRGVDPVKSSKGGRRQYRLALWSALTLALWANVCKRPDCAAIGCVQGVDVVAARDPSAELEPGVYRVETVGDGKLSSCQIELPAVTTCSEQSALFVSAYRGDAPFGFEILGIRVGTTPKELHVRVYRDDVLVGEGEYSLTYSHTQYGGDDDPCKVECDYAGRRDLVLTE